MSVRKEGDSRVDRVTTLSQLGILASSLLLTVDMAAVVVYDKIVSAVIANPAFNQAYAADVLNGFSGHGISITKALENLSIGFAIVGVVGLGASALILTGSTVLRERNEKRNRKAEARELVKILSIVDQFHRDTMPESQYRETAMVLYIGGQPRVVVADKEVFGSDFPDAKWIS